ncbi:uncharacterized protein LOC113466327 [Diaphorina citri]|uniref:Uncharacterized protein LOC113466327 n=1 Tax=Diaphorina citri TaxID=121845 RepID=A0A3Q0ISV5_DIACI|nr:uncharacterized protein LOC113466327 [Diaphorina citri]
MVDFLHAVTSLSFALFHFQTAQGLVEFTKMYVFLIVCILHQFLNNYFGEIMKYWQSQLSYSTYETPWYFRDRQFKKSIQIITARTRVPIMLNGLKMYVLCLASFIEFMKRIFSLTARTRVPIMLNGLKMYVLCLASFIEADSRIDSSYSTVAWGSAAHYSATVRPMMAKNHYQNKTWDRIAEVLFSTILAG